MAPALNEMHPNFFVYFSHVQRNATLSMFHKMLYESENLQVKYLNRFIVKRKGFRQIEIEKTNLFKNKAIIFKVRNKLPIEVSFRSRV